MESLVFLKCGRTHGTLVLMQLARYTLCHLDSPTNDSDLSGVMTVDLSKLITSQFNMCRDLGEGECINIK